MTTKTVYITADGTHFDEESDALRYESFIKLYQIIDRDDNTPALNFKQCEAILNALSKAGALVIPPNL